MNDHDDQARRALRARVPPRRQLLRTMAGMGTALFTGQVASQPIEQPRNSNAAMYMQRAFAMRDLAVQRGDQAFGAVVVRDQRIIGEGVSAVITSTDPTAHGEIQAIRDACRRLGTRELRPAELYSSYRPCAMCEAAAYWAGITRIFHSESVIDGGAPRLSRC